MAGLMEKKCWRRLVPPLCIGARRNWIQEEEPVAGMISDLGLQNILGKH